ncbi:MAG: cytochrome c-type biogenesis CcmF C-terminal domain-containing protein, partial [Azospirillaceae bacterium]
GPLLAWKRADLAGALGRLWAAALAVIVIVLTCLFLVSGAPVFALIGIALAAWAFFGALVELAERVRLFRVPLGASWQRLKGLPRSAFGLTLAHAGLGIAIAGMVGTEMFKEETVVLMAPGDTTEIAGMPVTFEGVSRVEGPNYLADQGRLTAIVDGEAVTLLPEKRFYPVAAMPTTEAAIHTTWFYDVYVALGEPREDGRWSVRLWHHPLVPWIWMGAATMVAGGLVSLSDRRLRVGVPAKRRQPSAQPAPAE